jgi:nitrite reductase (NADH) small subunit
MTLLDDISDLPALAEVTWTSACPYDYLIPGRGVGVLLDDGSQAALFRLDDGSLHALGNIDPFSGAAVLSRGIVGDRGGRAAVQSPITKQAFAFEDGYCLDEASVTVPVYPTRIVDGMVHVGRRGPSHRQERAA